MKRTPFAVQSDTLRSKGWKWAVHRKGKGLIPSALGLCSKMHQTQKGHRVMICFSLLGDCNQGGGTKQQPCGGKSNLRLCGAQFFLLVYFCLWSLSLFVSCQVV